MRICGWCYGKGKFEGYEIVVPKTGLHSRVCKKNRTVKVPEQPCNFCNGKGYIGAPQMEGYPPVIGCKI